ncbi:MAG: phosphatase PAP2 family protein [Gammaproteobacteria bacterium]
MMISENRIIRRCHGVDLRLVELSNRLSLKKGVRPAFAIVSRMGDGVFWYSLILLLPVMLGTSAISVSLQMTLAGLLGLVLYKYIKHLTERARPFAVSANISLGTAPLDQYSFPSGHTLHAVSFTLIALHYYPPLAWGLVPLTVLIALSRVVLGLHYPTDVLAGATLGTALAISIIVLWS